jgi:hypothetical protein
MLKAGGEPDLAQNPLRNVLQERTISHRLALYLSSEFAQRGAREGRVIRRRVALRSLSPVCVERGFIDPTLLPYGGLQRPLWIRRVLVRAQEGQ